MVCVLPDGMQLGKTRLGFRGRRGRRAQSASEGSQSGDIFGRESIVIHAGMPQEPVETRLHIIDEQALQKRREKHVENTRGLH